MDTVPVYHSRFNLYFPFNIQTLRNEKHIIYFAWPNGTMPCSKHDRCIKLVFNYIIPIFSVGLRPICYKILHFIKQTVIFFPVSVDSFMASKVGTLGKGIGLYFSAFSRYVLVINIKAFS